MTATSDEEYERLRAIDSRWNRITMACVAVCVGTSISNFAGMNSATTMVNQLATVLLCSVGCYSLIRNARAGLRIDERIYRSEREIYAASIQAARAVEVDLPTDVDPRIFFLAHNAWLSSIRRLPMPPAEVYFTGLARFAEDYQLAAEIATRTKAPLRVRFHPRSARYRAA